MIIARQLADTLYEFGIRRVYGLPGEDHMAVLSEFEAAGFDYCTAYNESSAVIMAAADSQVTGLPGVAILSLAPGVSNGLNGLLNAYLEQVPVLLISGQHPQAQLPFVIRQGFDIEHLVAPMTKWRVRITPDMDIGNVVGNAIDESMSRLPGPVYLELPDGVAGAAASPMRSAVVARLRQRWLTPGRADERRPREAVVNDLAQRLAAAKRPAVVVGGRRRRLTSATAVAFAGALRAPVFTSSRQKGLIDSAATPYFAGTFLNGTLERGLLASCDLVLLVDPDPFDFYNRPWCFEADALALTEDAFGEWLNPLAEQIVTDAEAMLRALTGRLRNLPGGPGSVWQPDEVADYRADIRSRLLAPSGDGMSVAQAVDAALSGWPTDGYLVADAGFSKPLVAMLSEPSSPDRYLASNALSTMGYCIPAAIAAGRAGARPVLGFLGDGSLLMRATELLTSPGTGGHTTFVAILDRSLTQIEVKQRRRQLAPVGVSLPAISCARLGVALGFAAADIDNPDELRKAVAEGLNGGGPTLIGAVVDPQPSRELFELLRG